METYPACRAGRSGSCACWRRWCEGSCSCSRSHRDNALRAAQGPRGNPDPVLEVLAPELPSALRELESVELPLPEFPGPVGRQRAVRGAGRGILGDADPRGEVSRDEVGALPLRRDDRTQTLELLQKLHVRSDGADLGFFLVHRQIFLGWGREDLPRLPAQGPHQILGSLRAWRRFKDGEIQADPRTLLDDLEGPSLRLEGHGLSVHRIENDRRRGQGAMSAKVQLRRRGEPAQLVLIMVRDEESGHREIVLPGDEQQHLVVKPAIQRTDHGGISRKARARESVDVIGGDFQGFSSWVLWDTAQDDFPARQSYFLSGIV